MWKRWSDRWTGLCTVIAPSNSPGRSELALRLGLIGAHSSGFNRCLVVALAFHWSARKTAKNVDLPDVGQGIGDRPLIYFLERSLHWLTRSQEVIELLEGGEKSYDFLLPRQRLRIVPRPPALRDRQSPIKKVADMRQNLPRRAHALAGLKLGKALRRVTHGFTPAIRDRGKSM